MRALYWEVIALQVIALRGYCTVRALYWEVIALQVIALRGYCTVRALYWEVIALQEVIALRGYCTVRALYWEVIALQVIALRGYCTVRALYWEVIALQEVIALRGYCTVRALYWEVIALQEHCTGRLLHYKRLLHWIDLPTHNNIICPYLIFRFKISLECGKIALCHSLIIHSASTSDLCTVGSRRLVPAERKICIASLHSLSICMHSYWLKKVVVVTSLIGVHSMHGQVHSN